MRCFSDATREQNLTVYADASLLSYPSSFTGVELQQYRALSFAFGSYAITSSDPLVGSNTEAASFLGDVDSLASGIVVDVRDCSFSNHTCTSQPSLDPFLGGAGVRIESASTAVLTRLIFEDNYARQGAGLHLKAVDTTLLWDSSFSNNVAAREGGAIALVDTGEAGLLIGATNVTNCTALIGGAVYGGAGTAIAVTNGSMLNGNKALTHGGAVYCDGCQSFAMRDSTVISWNEAPQSGGGGYFDMGLLISMEECFVSNNRAGVDGGAIFVDGNGATLSNITTCAFTSNTAQGDGGACAFNGGATVLASNHFELNHAGSRGGAVAYTYRCFVPGSPDDTFPCDGNVKLPLTVYVLDQGGLNVTSGTLRASVSVATALNKSSSGNGSDPLLYGQTEAYADPFGVITITDMMLRAVPGPYTLTVSLPDYPTSQVPPESRPLTVRACTLGEVQPSNDTCMTCPATTYSFTPTASHCIAPCPANANCSGGATVVPALGYWHSAPNSTYMAACPNGGACQGDRSALLACQNGTYMPLTTSGQLQSMPNNCSLESAVDSTDQLSYMRQQCTPGYYGPLHHGTTIVAYAVSFVLVLLFLDYTIRVTIRENSEAWESSSNDTGAAELIRVVTVWLQYMSILGNVNIPVPGTVHWVFSVASFAFSSITSGSLSLDCLIRAGPLRPALKRLLVHLAVPVINLLLLSTWQLFWWSRSKRRKAPTASVTNPVQSALAASVHSAAPSQSASAELRQGLLVTLLAVLFYYYPSLLTNAWSLFACCKVDRLSGVAYPQNSQAAWAQGYWVSDMTLQCFTGLHLKWSMALGVPLLFLVCLVIPLLPAMLLMQHRRHLDSPSTRLSLGFIYHPYKPSFWFWENWLKTRRC
ncbi:hypothetical protein WJX82_008793 [Trebouxia sp. C0006]